MRDMNEIGLTFNAPVCNNCIHHIEGDRCDAFDSIPKEILMGDNDHSKPLKGQKNDIVFEPISKKE